MYKHRYHINVFYSEDDECYIADVPDLKYISAFGPTPEKAVRELQVAIENAVEANREEGRPIPGPRYMPAMYKDLLARPSTRPASKKRLSSPAKSKPKRAAAA